ncbi:hypothetical protein [Frankia sp. CiP1_Cm_nod1]|uniref:hypothetical protein n=1 Tax=Frankia sp. CiP1_Cm_nod1 TaxID=2897160 RepID=UPI0020240D67
MDRFLAQAAGAEPDIRAATLSLTVARRPDADDSFDAKTIGHALYEQARLPGASAARRSEPDAEQDAVLVRVPVSAGAVDLTQGVDPT